MGLKADHIEKRSVRVVLTELDHGVVLFPGARIAQADRLQRAVAQGVFPAAGHHFHRHAAFKHAAVVEAVNLRLFGGDQLADKGRILFLRHRAVYIIRRSLVIAGGEIGVLHVNTVQCHDGSHRVVEMQVEFRTELGDPPGDRVTAEGAGGDHGDAVRDLRDFFPDHRHKRMLFQGFGNLAGECRPVYR